MRYGDQGSGTEADREQWESQMMQFLPELDHGDQLVVFCAAHQPTFIFYNESKRGQINDPRFCSALFQVWLHPELSKPPFLKARSHTVCVALTIGATFADGCIQLLPSLTCRSPR
jgi:hypothetical protein